MLIPITIALIGTFTLNIGFLFQKSEASDLPSFSNQPLKDAIKSVLDCKKWLFGTTLTSTGWLLFLIAVTLAPLSVIAPLNNVGVLILAIFAMVYLNESLQVFEWGGFIAILIGVIFIPLFSPPVSESQLSYDTLVLIILTGLLILLLLFFKVAQTAWFPTKNGSILGIASGITAGLGAVYTKVLSVVFDDLSALILVLLLIILFQLLSFITLQSAFKEERATIIVPLFNSFSTLSPILFGIGVFGEIVPPGQLLGILLIVIGSSLLFQYSGSETIQIKKKE
jgi:uncharacterized membrane protein